MKEDERKRRTKGEIQKTNIKREQGNIKKEKEMER